MQYNNNYRNAVLTNDGYYRQQLSSIEDKNGYEENKDNHLIPMAGVAGVAISAKFLYEQGAMRNYIHDYISKFADSPIQDYGYIRDMVNQYTKDDSMRNAIAKMKADEAIQLTLEKAKIIREQKKIEALTNLDIIRQIKEKRAVYKALTNMQDINLDTIADVEIKMNQKLKQLNQMQIEVEQRFFQRTGFKHATIRDIFERLSDEDKVIINSLAKDMPEIFTLRADAGVLIDAKGKIVDTRRATAATKKIFNDMINDLQIPVLNINPLKMFHIDDYLNLHRYQDPVFSIINPNEVQPLISGNTKELGKSMVQVGDKILDLADKRFIDGSFEAVSTYHHDAKLLAKMTGIGQNGVVNNGSGFLSKIAERLEYGAQPTKYLGEFELTNPASWLPSLTSKIIDKTSPLSVSSPNPRPYGYNTSRVFFKKGLKAKDVELDTYMNQFLAGRENMKNITKSSMVPYMLTERLNSALESFGLGLSNKSLGSATDVFKNLLTKRALPVLGIIGGLKYLDYLLEDKKTKRSSKDEIVDMMAGADIELSRVRDELGLNKKIKRFKEISPGTEYIEEIPIFGKILNSKTEEEADKYWEEGNVPIRKGRWWSLGNTPYTGDKVEYYKPNIKRLVQSDYQYTDVMYGSKDEYYANAPIPTITHPLSPIKHFITDKYHWEEKHMEDRPYPVSGGIQELKEIPLIGGPLDATVGRVLKPTRYYHQEYWSNNPEGEMSNGYISNNYIKNNNSSKAIISNDINSSINNSNQKERYLKSAQKEAELPHAQLMGSNLSSLGNKQNKTIYGKQKEDPLLISPTTLGLENMYYDATEIGGFYGFSANTVFGEGLKNQPRPQRADEMLSYQKSFWDKSLGGYGGDLSEISRRFIPNKRYNEKRLEVNPIRNTMPTWLPGEEYYINFLTGDPYNKVKEGEYRLPGAGYEALHNLPDPTELSIGSSSLGKSVPDIVKHFLQIDDVEIAGNESLKDILASGTLAHEEQEALDLARGKAVATEVHIVDKENKIEGYIDSIIKDKSSSTGYAILDYKTINQKGFDKAKQGLGKFENVTQIQWYMHMTGQKVGYLKYINRDNPEEEPITLRYNYDPEFVKGAYKRLSKARNIIHEGLEQKIIQRGDLYKPIDRFRILADVAPYSAQYRYYDRLMSQLPLQGEDPEKVEQIRKEVKEKKKSMRLTPYKFKYSDLNYDKVTVDRVLDNGLILAKEYPNNPIRMAGLNADPEVIKKYIKPNQGLKIGFGKEQFNADNTMTAVLYNKNQNINKVMIDSGEVEERTEDNSPTSINARYTPNEIQYGKMFEKFSHADTAFNNKFMQARSALEMYKRRDLYGKSFKKWENPISDFLIPMGQEVTSKNPAIAALTGGIIGSMFGRKGSPMRLLTTATGALLGGLFASKNALNEEQTDTPYIPKVRQKEREINEYADILKYVKNIKLFSKYRQLAMEKEGVDPARYVNKQKNFKQENERIKWINEVKTKLNQELISPAEAAYQVGYKGMLDEKDIRTRMNKEVNYINSLKPKMPETPLAQKALSYLNEANKTMYGYEPGANLSHFMSAMNRKERKYMKPFLEAPIQERKEIIDLVPNYMKRPLQYAYGMKVDNKPNLKQYFKKHYLPGDDWAGWNEEVNMDDVKLKIVKHEAMDMSEFDFWQNDEERASYLDIPVPRINYEQDSSILSQRLNEVLNATGLEDVMISTSPNQSGRINVNFNLQEDRRNEINAYVKDYGVGRI